MWVSLRGQWADSWTLLQVSWVPLVSWVPQVSVVPLVPRVFWVLLVSQVSRVALVSLVLVNMTDVAHAMGFTKAPGIGGCLGCGQCQACIGYSGCQGCGGCVLPGSLQQKCFTIKFRTLPASPFIWLPGLVGASDGVSHIQGMVGTLLGFAAGVSGAPGVMGSWVPRMSRVPLVS